MYWKLIVFVVFSFAFAQILIIIQLITKISFDIIILPQLAPALAFFTTILLFRDMYKPLPVNLNKHILKRIIIVMLFPILLFTITYIIGSLMGIETNFQNELFKIIIVSIGGIIIGCIAEEIGWRSFLQPNLEQKHSVFISSLIVGVIWGLWHVSYYQNGISYMLIFIISTISAAIIVVFFQKNTKKNLIISASFHTSINIGVKIFFFNDSLRILNGIIWLIIAIIITMCDRKYMLKKAKLV